MSIKKELCNNAPELFMAGLCALVFAASKQYSVNNGFFVWSPTLVAHFFIYWVVFFAVFYGGRWLLSRPPRNDANSLSAFERIMCSLDQVSHPALVYGAIIFMFYLPVAIMMFPGVTCFDTNHMLVMYAEPEAAGISGHHPLFDTLVFGKVVFTVARLTDSFRAGVFFFLILQCLGTALSFGRVLVFSQKTLSLSWEVRFILLAFFSLFPLYSLFSLYFTKDSFFSIFFVLFFVEFLEMVITRGESLGRPSKAAVFVLLCLLCCLTKKLGVYIVLGSLAVYLIAIRKRLLVPTVAALSCALLMFGLYPVALSAAHISPGGMQEVLSVPFQQTGRYVLSVPQAITEDERTAIDAILSYDTIEQCYIYNNADGLKGYDRLASKPQESYRDYLKVWFAQGLRHPLIYFDAFVALNTPWFSFQPIMPLFSYGWNPELDAALLGQEFNLRPAVCEKTSSLLGAFYEHLCAFPIVGHLFTLGMWATLLPAFAISLLLRVRMRRYLVCIAPIALSIVLGMWCSPTALEAGNGMRYLIPVVYSMPAVLALCRYAILAESGFTESNCSR